MLTKNMEICLIIYFGIVVTISSICFHIVFFWKEIFSNRNFISIESFGSKIYSLLNSYITQEKEMLVGIMLIFASIDNLRGEELTNS